MDSVRRITPLQLVLREYGTFRRHGQDGRATRRGTGILPVKENGQEGHGNNIAPLGFRRGSEYSNIQAER
ncbi:MAG TPA: hypothetical protein VMO17_20570 [Terriglobia bacterium]|nr:hypothetical protein [Terriglobia bacterium]